MNLKLMLYGLGLIGVSFIAGLFAVVYSSLAGEKILLLAGLPALLALAVFLALDKTKLFILILFFRSAADILFATASFGSFGIGGLINLLVIVIALMFVLERPGGFTKLMASIWGPLLFIAILSISYTPDIGGALKTLNALLTYFSVFVIAFYLVKDKSDYKYFINLILLSSILPVLYAFVDIGLHFGHMGNGDNRLKSTFGHANIFAFYLVLVISLLFYKIKSTAMEVSQFIKIGFFFYILILMGLLLLTQTRSAWGACLFTFAIYGLIFERRYLVYLMLSGFFALLIPSVRDRVLDLGAGNEYVRYAKLNSFAWRKLLWQSALNWMEPVRYVFGYGLESFKYLCTDFFAGGKSFGAHSIFVQWFFETGIVGILTAVWMYFKMVFTLKDGLKSDRVGTVITFLIIAGYMMEAYSDNILVYLSFNWYFWFFMGASCALVVSERNKIAPTEDSDASNSAKPKNKNRFSTRGLAR